MDNLPRKPPYSVSIPMYRNVNNFVAYCNYRHDVRVMVLEESWDRLKTDILNFSGAMARFGYHVPKSVEVVGFQLGGF